MKKRLPVVNELGVELLHQVDASTILDRRHSVGSGTIEKDDPIWMRALKKEKQPTFRLSSFHSSFSIVPLPIFETQPLLVSHSPISYHYSRVILQADTATRSTFCR